MAFVFGSTPRQLCANLSFAWLQIAEKLAQESKHVLLTGEFKTVLTVLIWTVLAFSGVEKRHWAWVKFYL